MDTCFEGVGQVTATFQVDGEELRPGMAAVLTDSGAVGMGDDGDAPCGVVLGGMWVGAAAVQIGGAAKVSYTGTAPKAGWQGLACDGKGGIKTAASGLKCLVLAVDEDEKTVVVKL